MREMWVDPRFFDKKSFGCFEDERVIHEGGDQAIPVVVLTKEEWEKIKPVPYYIAPASAADPRD